MRIRACLKQGVALGSMSVPPAVAGGSTITITHGGTVDPPAAAGGTDIDPSQLLFKAKLVFSLKPERAGKLNRMPLKGGSVREFLKILKADV